MPLLVTKRAGTCSACGGAIQKGEQAWYEAASGLRHPEPQCQQAASTQHRPNERADRCSCGEWVPARHGRLVNLGERLTNGRWVQQWGVRCFRCR